MQAMRFWFFILFVSVLATPTGAISVGNSKTNANTETNSRVHGGLAAIGKFALVAPTLPSAESITEQESGDQPDVHVGVGYSNIVASAISVVFSKPLSFSESTYSHKQPRAPPHSI
ncbi:MAG: hypothetical protein WEA82_00250 [Idiomarina sp.]